MYSKFNYYLIVRQPTRLHLIFYYLSEMIISYSQFNVNFFQKRIHFTYFLNFELISLNRIDFFHA